jgi:hypothetical protein
MSMRAPSVSSMTITEPKSWQSHASRFSGQRRAA